MSLGKLQLNRLIPIFWREKYICPKQTKKKQNKNKSIKSKLMETLNVNQFYTDWDSLFRGLSLENKNIKMGKNSWPWVKVDPLVIIIFWFYNLAAWRQKKLLFSLKIYYVRVTPRSKKSPDFLRYCKFTTEKKIEEWEKYT